MKLRVWCSLTGWISALGILLGTVACHTDAGLVLSLDHFVRNTDVPENMLRYHYFRQAYTDSSYQFIDSLVRSEASIPTTRGVTWVYGVDGSPQLVKSWSADVQYGDVRFRMSLLQPFSWLTESGVRVGTQPLQLLLSPYGQDSVGIGYHLPGMGRLRTRTYFQVDRQFFFLESVDTLHSSISIQPLEHVPAEAVVARWSTRLGKVPVRTLANEPTYLPNRPGKERFIIFWSMSPDRGQLLRTLSQHPERTSSFDILTINTLDRSADISAFWAEHNIPFPALRASDQTCRSLLCYAHLPYAIWVDDQGRIVNSYLTAKQLLTQLGISDNELQ